ncbi:CTR-like PK [Tribonema minus]|uniref:CTR-like PK n=1 Tax=Tribonema minus TaxID=303371 RepID=A0A835YIR4_9STRA|nr:CTR-like PK [Tribonema minus]
MQAVAYSDLTVGEKIGGGGVGLVHRGWYNRKPVALKVLFDARMNEELIREFTEEVNVLAQLRHPNIVRVLGGSTSPPHLFFLMELCESSVYEELHIKRRRYGMQELLKIALDTVYAMQYLHSQSPPVVHRDLKSHNLLIGADGNTKLCDFGLVCTSSTTAGTPCYMAPELLQNRPFTKSVDVYAFGILLWELFSQDLPFRGLEVGDVKEVVTAGQRPTVPRGDTPRQIRDMMEQCWAQVPMERPTFGQCVPVLQELVQEHSSRSHVDDLDDFGGDSLDCLLK